MGFHRGLVWTLAKPDEKSLQSFYEFLQPFKLTSLLLKLSFRYLESLEISFLLFVQIIASVEFYNLLQKSLMDNILLKGWTQQEGEAPSVELLVKRLFAFEFVLQSFLLDSAFHVRSYELLLVRVEGRSVGAAGTPNHWRHLLFFFKAAIKLTDITHLLVDGPNDSLFVIPNDGALVLHHDRNLLHLVEQRPTHLFDQVSVTLRLVLEEQLRQRRLVCHL